MIKGSIREISGPIVKLRRQLHSIPEIAFNEKRTSSLISKHLLESGLEVIGGIGKTGVIGKKTVSRKISRVTQRIQKSKSKQSIKS